jgi:hypothetical protein
MLLIEYLSFVSDFLAYPRARRLVFGLGIGERGYLLTPRRFYTRLEKGKSSHLWRGFEARFVNSVILIAVSPLRVFMSTSTARPFVCRPIYGVPRYE